MKIYTKPKVLKKAWKILKEIGLQELISGSAEENSESFSVEVKAVGIIDEMLDKDKLNEFCQTITQSEIDFNDMELASIMDIVSDFFSRIGKSFGRVGLPMNMMKKDS